jgi:hypothetical protein
MGCRFTFGLGYRLLEILLLISTRFVEIAQLLVPGRHARLSDFIFGAAAAWTGLIGVRMH